MWNIYASFMRSCENGKKIIHIKNMFEKEKEKKNKK